MGRSKKTYSFARLLKTSITLFHSKYKMLFSGAFSSFLSLYCEFHNLVVNLKVLTNEQRGGLKVVAFYRYPFKLFTLRFSSKSLQAPSCERPKTIQQTLFLSFKINNCLPIPCHNWLLVQLIMTTFASVSSSYFLPCLALF